MKKAWNILGIVFGVLAIVFGIIILTQDTGYHPDSASFGGDFYTYSYKATRAAALNIDALLKVVKLSFGFLMFVLGGADICYFGQKCEKVSTEKTAIDVAADEPVKEEIETSLSQEETETAAGTDKEITDDAD